MEDIQYIKEFSKITIKKICEDNKVTPSNLWSNRLSKKKLHAIKTSIESEVAKLYIKE